MRTEANNRRSLLVTASVMLILDLIVLYFRPWDQLSLFGMVPLALVLTWSLWILGLGSRSTKLVATVIFWVIASVVLATMALQLSGAVPNPAGPGRYNAGPYIMLMILCILAYLVFSTRSGLRASLGILVATVLLNLAWVTDRAVAGELAIPIATVVIYEGLLGVTILLLHGLAQSKDEHAVALLEAERMRSMAYQDSLTGLPNRRMLEEALSR